MQQPAEVAESGQPRRGQSQQAGRSYGVWAIPALIALGIFLLWPLGTLIWRGISLDGSLTDAFIRNFATERFYWERLWFTIWQALASTALALLVGIPSAYVFAHVRFPGRSVLRAVLTVPIVLPTLVVAMGLRELLGPTGWVNRLLDQAGMDPISPFGTVWVLLLAHVIFGVAIVVRLVAAVWANLDPEQGEAARLLGATRMKAFTTITLPMLVPAVAAAALLVFIFAFTSFAVVLLLGGIDRATVEVTLFVSGTGFAPLPEAAILAVLQLVAMLVALVLYVMLQQRGALAVHLRAHRTKRVGAASGWERLLVVIVLLAIAILVIAPLAALVHGAVTLPDGSFSTRYFTLLFEDGAGGATIEPLDAIIWSLIYAIGATAIALLLGTGAAMAVSRGRSTISTVTDVLLMLPLAVPAVTLSLAFLLTYNTGWYDFEGTRWLLLAAHVLIVYPFVVRTVLSVSRTLNPSLPEAAAMLGASPMQIWRHIELPIIARAVMVAAGFSFAISMGEFGATSLLWHSDSPTMPIAIFESLSQPGADSLGMALAMATILMLITVVAFVLIERFRYRGVGEV